MSSTRSKSPSAVSENAAPTAEDVAAVALLKEHEERQKQLDSAEALMAQGRREQVHEMVKAMERLVESMRNVCSDRTFLTPAHQLRIRRTTDMLIADRDIAVIETEARKCHTKAMDLTRRCNTLIAQSLDMLAESRLFREQMMDKHVTELDVTVIELMLRTVRDYRLGVDRAATDIRFFGGLRGAIIDGLNHISNDCGVVTDDDSNGTSQASSQ
jgi:hypothetical protein